MNDPTVHSEVSGDAGNSEVRADTVHAEVNDPAMSPEVRADPAIRPRAPAVLVDHAMKVMGAALAVGEAMLRSRAPTSEVEQSVRRLTAALELGHCEVSVTMNQLTLSLVDSRLDAPMTMVKVVDLSEVRLDLLVEVEDLIRAAESGDADVETTTRELPRIVAEEPIRPRWLNSAFYLVSVAGWVAFASGGWVGVAAGVIGALFMQTVLLPVSRNRLPDVFIVALSAMVAVAAPATAAYLEAPIALTPAIVGGLFPLLPGGALAASVTDWLGGAPLSGMAKGLQVALEALGLALGAVAALTVVDQLGIEATVESAMTPDYLIAAAAVIATVGLALSRAMPLRLAPGVGAVTLAAWLVAWAMPESTAAFPPGVALAAVAIGVGAQVVARIQHTNPTIYTTTSVFVLAPGLLTYMAMVALTSGDTEVANELLVQALGIAGAVAAGIALGSSLTRTLPVPRQRTRPWLRPGRSGYRTR